MWGGYWKLMMDPSDGEGGYRLQLLLLKWYDPDRRWCEDCQDPPTATVVLYTPPSRSWLTNTKYIKIDLLEAHKYINQTTHSQILFFSNSVKTECPVAVVRLVMVDSQALSRYQVVSWLVHCVLTYLHKEKSVTNIALINLVMLLHYQQRHQARNKKLLI